MIRLYQYRIPAPSEIVPGQSGWVPPDPGFSLVPGLILTESVYFWVARVAGEKGVGGKMTDPFAMASGRSRLVSLCGWQTSDPFSLYPLSPPSLTIRRFLHTWAVLIPVPWALPCRGEKIKKKERKEETGLMQENTHLPGPGKHSGRGGLDSRPEPRARLPVLLGPAGSLGLLVCHSLAQYVMHGEGWKGGWLFTAHFAVCCPPLSVE